MLKTHRFPGWLRRFCQHLGGRAGGALRAGSRDLHRPRHLPGKSWSVKKRNAHPAGRGSRCHHPDLWGRGKLPHPDGRPTHTFRSYTAFFSGGSVTVEDLTIANDAGPGSAVGQAIAAYVDAEKGRVPPGKAAGQPGHALLRAPARG